MCCQRGSLHAPILLELAVRVLYKLHSGSSSSPFDPMAYALFHPFLERILQINGAGQLEEEEALEQLTLAIEIIQFHIPQCMSRPPSIYSTLLILTRLSAPVVSNAYPRVSVLRAIIDALAKYPQLAKTTSDILLDFGETTHTSTTTEETMTLINGLLSQESFVRHACLQALQVRSVHFMPEEVADFVCSAVRPH